MDSHFRATDLRRSAWWPLVSNFTRLRSFFSEQDKDLLFRRGVASRERSITFTGTCIHGLPLQLPGQIEEQRHFGGENSGVARVAFSSNGAVESLRLKHDSTVVVAVRSWCGCLSNHAESFAVHDGFSTSFLSHISDRVTSSLSTRSYCRTRRRWVW